MTPNPPLVICIRFSTEQLVLLDAFVATSYFPPVRHLGMDVGTAQDRLLISRGRSLNSSSTSVE